MSKVAHLPIEVGNLSHVGRISPSRLDVPVVNEMVQNDLCMESRGKFGLRQRRQIFNPQKSTTRERERTVLRTPEADKKYSVLANPTTGAKKQVSAERQRNCGGSLEIDLLSCPQFECTSSFIVRETRWFMQKGGRADTWGVCRGFESAVPFQIRI